MTIPPPNWAIRLPDAAAGALAGARCLVTGGAGFVGSNLSRVLLRLGARVTVLDSLVTGRRENLPQDQGLELVEDDLARSKHLGGLVREADYVFHLAAQVGNVKSLEHPVEDATTNVLGSVRLYDACRGTRVRRVVYSSSSACFGEAERIPLDEDHPQRPASFYALSKQAGEKYALLAHSLWGVPASCLRYFNVYGLPMEDNEYTGVISIFFRRLAAGQPLVIYGDGGAFRDFVHVADVVAANLRAALLGPAGRVWNIGTGRKSTVLELARTMAELAGSTAALEFRPARAGEVRESLADIARARRELGYEPAFDLRAGLAEVFARAWSPSPS